jgi:hypothetical protein
MVATTALTLERRFGDLVAAAMLGSIADESELVLPTRTNLMKDPGSGAVVSEPVSIGGARKTASASISIVRAREMVGHGEPFPASPKLPSRHSEYEFDRLKRPRYRSASTKKPSSIKIGSRLSATDEGPRFPGTTAGATTATVASFFAVG